MSLSCAENGLARFGALLDEVLPRNAFCRERLGARRDCTTFEEYRRLPFLTKRDLVADAVAHPPFGTNLTYPLEQYTRYHQTSGTTAAPLRVLDTAQTWDWWGQCWLEVLRRSGVTARDRLLFAFSFAPAIGFWSAHHGAGMLGALCIPTGGVGSLQRLRMILDTGATVLLGTPGYILHLAERARSEGLSLADVQVRVLIHAGEPGASVPATRARLAEAWNGARVIDHAGATEIGAYGLGCPLGLGVHINEDEFIAEVVGLDSDEPVADGAPGELVLTGLGRGAWPAIRYKSGDVVRPRRGTCGCGSSALLLEGGILGRVDDMVVIRGQNVFPSAVEDVIRGLTAAEFRIVATRRGTLDELAIELEGTHALADKTARSLRESLGMRVDVAAVEEGTLPRWEGKARRFVDRRNQA
jgi:phenylacetate-CoA ligase